MKHKHIWKETTLSQDDKTHKSYACKCGCWKIDFAPIKVTNFKIKNWKTYPIKVFGKPIKKNLLK